LTLLTASGPEFVSLNQEWPMQSVTYAEKTYQMPDILQR
jgi:hypothetical protein